MTGSSIEIGISEFATTWGLTLQEGEGHLDVDRWGLAAVLRKEVGRRGSATTRDIFEVIVPVLEALGIDPARARGSIRSVLDLMATLGDVETLRGTSQVFWCRPLPRCIFISETRAALLGQPSDLDAQVINPCDIRTQCVRWIDLSNDSTHFQLGESAVPTSSLVEWAGQPSWYDELNRSNNLTSLWNDYTDQLMTHGQPVSGQPDAIRVLSSSPGGYFGKVSLQPEGRWGAAVDLPSGVMLGAQLGHNDNHWHPMLLKAELGCPTSAIFLDDWELFRWLLLAKGNAEGSLEVATFDSRTRCLKSTCPLPTFYRRILALCAVPSAEKAWTWTIPEDLSPDFWTLGLNPCRLAPNSG